MDGIIGQESSTLDPAKLTLHTRDDTADTGAKQSHSVLDSSPTSVKFAREALAPSIDFDSAWPCAEQRSTCPSAWHRTLGPRYCITPSNLGNVSLNVSVLGYIHC